MFKLTANECHSARRRRRPIALDDGLLESLDASTSPGAHDQASAREFRLMLDLALLELPWRQRAVWLLREIEGLSYDEIADALHTTPSVVRGQLHRGRATLRVRMAQWQ